MKLTSDERGALGVALNEATLLGVELDEVRRVVSATFAVLSLPEVGLEAEDRRVQFVFHPVGRIAASLRNGHWDDGDAEVVPFEASDLLSVVQSFGGSEIYGWEFFDRHDEELAGWGQRLSLDWGSQTEGMNHSISLFQEEGGERHLDLCIWFDSFEIRTPTGKALSLSDFSDGGRRWWDALSDGDPRTSGHGIVLGG